MSGPAGDVQATASLSPATATVGDRIELTVTVLHGGTESAAPPALVEGDARIPLGPGQKLGELEVVEARPPRVRAGAESTRETRFGYVLTSFDVGTYEIPALEVQVGGPAGAVASVPPQRIEVTSVLPQMNADEVQAQEIRDIKGPATIPPDFTPWVLAALGLCVLVLALLLLRRRLRRPRKRAAPVQPALPPFEEAMAALAALEARQLPESGAFRELGFELSEIMRRYLSRRFHVQALEATTREVMRELGECREVGSLRGGIAPAIHRLLEETDLLKFAKYVPAPSVGGELLAEARRLLEVTRAAGGESPASHEEAA